jgi:hypothetical protein
MSLDVDNAEKEDNAVMTFSYSRTMPLWVRGAKGEKVLSGQPSPDAVNFDMTPASQNTFFQLSINEYEDNNDKEEADEENNGPSKKSSTMGGMFGTYEEQRLQMLDKRVGMQTEAEMDDGSRRNSQCSI